MRFIRRSVALFALITCLVLPAANAYAYNPLSSACGSGGDAKKSSACSATGADPLTGTNGAIHKVSLVLATIAGITAVIIIIIAGMQFITADGDPQKAASARSAVIGAIVGLVIIVLAESLVLFVLSKL